MTPFIKHWLTSTCAPDSCVNIKSSPLGYLDCVYNEDKSIKVYVLSNDDIVVSLGVSYAEILIANNMSFTDAALKCASLMNLAVYAL